MSEKLKEFVRRLFDLGKVKEKIEYGLFGEKYINKLRASIRKDYSLDLLLISYPEKHYTFDIISKIHSVLRSAKTTLQRYFSSGPDDRYGRGEKNWRLIEILIDKERDVMRVREDLREGLNPALVPLHNLRIKLGNEILSATYVYPGELLHLYDSLRFSEAVYGENEIRGKDIPKSRKVALNMMKDLENLLTIISFYPTPHAPLAIGLEEISVLDSEKFKKTNTKIFGEDR